MENTNKIYARLDKNNVVVRMFSSVFEKPLDTDKLVEQGNEEYHAHVHLKYTVIDENGNYNYKYLNNRVIELTETEKEILFPKPVPQPSETEIMIANLLKTNAEQQSINATLLKEIAELKGVE